MFGLGPTEMLVVGVIAVVLFGGNLPSVARQFGTSYAEFRRSLGEVQKQFRMAENEVKSSFDPGTLDDEDSDADVDDFDDVAPAVPKFKPPV
ncbi:MAG: twin-arginine translocase TatA/TatE family subunit [Planctomycetota bacterium]